MAGQGRREEITDTLAGQALITPARLTGPGIQVPRMPVPAPSVSGKIAAELGVWADGFLTDAISKDNERSMMDGAIAQTQGVALEQLQLRGADAWALEGHRVINAQTLSSQLQASQVQLIEDSAYALGPDEYRNQLTEQLASLTDGQDSKTARMVRERVAEMLPDLVGKQTLAHANYQEQQVFNSVVQAIPAMSENATGANALLDMATGVHPSARGLSQARLDQAIMEGIVLSHVNMNPRAYNIMKAGGVLDNMTTDQLNRIEDSRTQYQTRLRNEFNVERFSRLKALDAKIKAGGFSSAAEATDEYISIETDYGIAIDTQRAGLLFDSAVGPANTAMKTRFLVAQAALGIGDWKQFGAATMGLIIHAESGHNAPPNIEGPVVLVGANAGERAQSPAQVMPATLVDPGFNIPPSNGTDADNLRVGQAYWAVMAAGNAHPSGEFKWEFGDIETASIAYIAGWTNANKFIESGRDYSVLPQPSVTQAYAKKVLKGYNDQEAPGAGDKHNIAVANLARIRKVVSAGNYSLFVTAAAEEDRRWIAGDITRAEWQENRAVLRGQYGVEMTTSIANAQLATTKARIKAVEKIADDNAKRNIVLEMHTVDLALQLVLDNDAATPNDMQAALEMYVEARDDVFRRNGVAIYDTDNSAGIASAIKRWHSVVGDHTTNAEEQAEINWAAEHGAVGTMLNDKLQDRFWKQEAAEHARERQAQFDTSSKTAADEVVYSSGLNDDIFYSYKNNGSVDPKYRAQESHEMKANLIVENKDGKKVVNQTVVQSVERYVRFKEIAPEIAHKYYDLEARVIAEAIMETAGPGGSLSQAAFDVGTRSAQTEAQRASMDAFMISDITNKEIKRAIDAVVEEQDLGILQAMFRSGADIADVLNKLPSEEEAVASPEVKALVRVGLERWLGRLKRAMPLADAAVLVPMAMKELKRHSAFLGDTFIVTPGTDLMQATFGDKAGSYAGVNSMNNAIMHYLVSDEVLAEHPELDDSTWTEFFPGFVQDIAAGVASVFVDDVSINRGSTNRDFFETMWRSGLRKWTATVDIDGNIVAQVWNLNGVPGTPIPIPLKKVGDLFMKDFPLTPDLTPSDRTIGSLVRRSAVAMNTMINRGVRLE